MAPDESGEMPDSPQEYKPDVAPGNDIDDSTAVADEVVETETFDLPMPNETEVLPTQLSEEARIFGPESLNAAIPADPALGVPASIPPTSDTQVLPQAFAGSQMPFQEQQSFGQIPPMPQVPSGGTQYGYQDPMYPMPTPQQPKKSRKWVVPVVAGTLAFLFGGVATGLTVNILNQRTITALEADVQTLEGTNKKQADDLKISADDNKKLKDQVSGLEDDLDTATTDLEETKSALEKTKKELKDATDALEENEKDTPAKPSGSQKSFSDGFYLVGKDIAPGTYRSDGTDILCYWERLSDDSGELEGIITNGLEFGEDVATVTIKADDYAFRSERCGVWSPLG